VAARIGWNSWRIINLGLTFSSSTHCTGCASSLAWRNSRKTWRTSPVPAPPIPARCPALETSTQGKPAASSSVACEARVTYTVWIRHPRCCQRAPPRRRPGQGRQGEGAAPRLHIPYPRQRLNGSHVVHKHHPREGLPEHLHEGRAHTARRHEVQTALSASAAATYFTRLPGSRVAFTQQERLMARLRTRQDKAPFRCQSRDGLEREIAWSENPLQLQRGCVVRRVGLTCCRPRSRPPAPEKRLANFICPGLLSSVFRVQSVGTVGAVCLVNLTKDASDDRVNYSDTTLPKLLAAPRVVPRRI
jgi:hypothetical protein